jgi:hypothetical protein
MWMFWCLMRTDADVHRDVSLFRMIMRTSLRHAPGRYGPVSPLKLRCKLMNNCLRLGHHLHAPGSISNYSIINC